MDTKQVLPKNQFRLGETHPEWIAILRALELGDLLCAVPAMRALRATLPEAKIVLIGLPWASSFVDRFHHYIDGLIEFPGYPGLPERMPELRKIPHFIQSVQRMNFDLALQMQGSGSIVNPLVALFGARINAGFYGPGEYCPDPDYFMPYPDDAHEIWRHLRLMEFLGISLQGDELEFPLEEADIQALRALPETGELVPGEYVCVHPGARASNRRWQPEQFAQVADGLAARGLRVVLTGSVEERDLTRAVANAMQAPALDLAGRTNLGALGVLLRGARLLVSNDTGISHVAAALAVPSVVIFAAADPKRWAPLNRERHRVLDGRTSNCAAVLQQAEELLEGERLHA